MENTEMNPEVISKELKRIGDDVKSMAEKAIKEARESAGHLSAETKKNVDEMLIKQGELQSRLSVAEQKLDAHKAGDKPTYKSVGDMVIESEEFAFMAKRKSGTFSLQLKAITSLADSGGAGVAPDRLPGLVVSPERKLHVRDLIAPGTTESNMVEYVRESGFTNNAAVVSENTLKPESSLTYELENAKVATIAHWIPASKQILDDFKALSSQIDARLRYGVKLAEDAQLLNGTGVGNNLLGLYVQATDYSAPAGAPASPTRIDVLRLMLLQVELAEYSADGIVLHPTDWAFIELTKTDEGAYLFANPTIIQGQRLWARPVVTTTSQAADTALVGSFKLGAQIFDREQANVVISTEDVDNFRKNMVTIRGEERLAMACYRPEAFVRNTNMPAI